ncbi:response regulator [Hyalangium gracile]|uniref:response regulator n=1 Tax=Hyalangium gracile TaxID=394092 RepID=UPI001CD02B21|nr:response regulator [Hyalangium gracile]
MKNILIVDHDRFTRAVMRSAFAPHTGFQLMMASSYLEALWALCEQEMDLVLIQMGMPEHQSFDLLTYMANYRSKVPVLTLSHARQTPSMGDVLCWRGHVARPIQPHALMCRVKDGLRDVERGDYRPVVLHDLLRILAHERSSCILRVKAGLRSGYFQLSSGHITHAVCGSSQAETAVRQMLSWQSAWFRVEPVPTRLGLSLYEEAPAAESVA